VLSLLAFFFFCSSRRRHTRFKCDWSSDVCSSDLETGGSDHAVRHRIARGGGRRGQSPLSLSSCRSHSGSCPRSRKCQLSPHPWQTTVFPSGSVWPPAVRRNSSLSIRVAVCWQWWQIVRVIFFTRYSPWMAVPMRVIFREGRE